MPISFDQVPDNWRIPGSFIEFNNELAGATSQEFQVIMIGQRLAAGTVAKALPVRVTNPAQAKTFFGRGSMLAGMAAAYLAANTTIPLWCVALDDLGGGAFAAGSITVLTAATGAGTLYAYLGGDAVAVGVASGDSATAIATSIVAAITANPDLSVTAAVDGTVASKVNITARHKGEAYNGYDVRVAYYGEAMPAGVTVTCVNLTGGSGNPDISDAIDVIGDEWYNWFVVPYTDSANMLVLKTELASRFSALRQKGGRVFSAYKATLSTTATFGGTQNSQHVTILGTGASPTQPYLAAAMNAAAATAALANDPARPLQTLVLQGMKAPARADQWIGSERNILLYDGIATYTVDRDGTCRIERQITTYQTNAAGMPDASYLDINSPETLERIRYEQRSMLAQKFPRHKVADDGTNYGAGQAIVTPSLVEGELLALYKVFEQKGWVEDFESYKATIFVERDLSNRNRINWIDHPNLVNQAITFAGKQQYIL